MSSMLKYSLKSFTNRTRILRPLVPLSLYYSCTSTLPWLISRFAKRTLYIKKSKRRPREEPVNTLNESFFAGMFVVNKTFFSYLWLLFLVITRKFSRFTRICLVITTSFLVITTFFLVITRNILVITTFVSRNYDFFLVITRNISRYYDFCFSLLRLFSR